MRTWSQMVSYHAARRPLAECVSDAVESVGFAEMATRMAQRAAWLALRGAARGKRVAVLSGNSTLLVEVLLACQHMGAVAVTLNNRLAPGELAYMLDQSGSCLIVADADREDLARAATGLAETAPPVAVFGRDDAIATLTPLPDAAPGADDLARLMYTSGTTSRPKGVMVSNRNIHAKSVALSREWGTSYHERGLIVGPMFHVGTLDITLTTATYSGGAVQIHDRFDARRTLEALRSGRVDHVWMSPTMIRAVIALAEEEGITCPGKPRLIVGGGEPSSVELIRRIAQVFPDTWYTDAYGLTETTVNTLMPAHFAQSRAGSVGLPIIEADVAILDDTGAPCPQGRTGQIAIGGDKVSPGYWRNPEATAESRRGGYFLTGDMGYLDPDGFLFIVGRLKDMILSGGENIAAAEVEEALLRHPAILEAAVVPRPDPKWGEVPAAFVVLHPGAVTDAAALQAHCLAHLSRIKQPKAFHFLDALPRTSIGKVQKSALVQMLQTQPA